MNFIVRFINKFITKDDLEEMRKSLGEIDSAETKRYEKLNEAQSAVRSNALVGLLNRNIIKLNYSTALYSKCILILTFVMTILTAISIVLLFKP